MAQQKIEFRKIRDFGENINDTFVFIGQNLGPLLKSVFAICGVLMLIQAILTAVYQYRSFDLFQKIFDGSRTGNLQLGEIFTGQYFIAVFFPYLLLTSMQVAATSYIKYYVENDRHQPGIDEVWALFLRYFPRVLLYNVLTGLMMILAMPFCFFPAIYLWVVFVPVPFVAMVEDRSFSDSVSRCFYLINENFWPALLLYFVMTILYSFGGGIVGLIVSAIVGLFSYLTTSDLRKTIGIASSFLNVFTYGFYVIFIVSAALHYFNLTEQKEGTGILSKIDQLGKKTNVSNSNEEQF